MPMPWFRLYHEFADDPKVQMLSEAMQRRYIMLLCLECSGELEKLSLDQIAFRLRLRRAEMIRTRDTLIRSGLVAVRSEYRAVLSGYVQETLEISAWNKRQCVSDDSNARVRKLRISKTPEKPVTVTGEECNIPVTVTPNATKCNGLDEMEMESRLESESEEQTPIHFAPPSAKTPRQDAKTDDVEVLATTAEHVLETLEAAEVITKPKERSIAAQVWDTYSEAFKERYGVTPVPNQRIRGQLTQFCLRVPQSEACHVARWYVLECNDLYTVNEQHSINKLLANAEKHRNSWAGAQRTTFSQSKLIDRASGMQDAVEGAIRLRNEREALKHAVR